MSTLQRRIYDAVLKVHPAAFRNQFSREMMLDFDDALQERGFPALIGDAFLSLVHQWKVRALTGPELEQPIPSHPFLAGQYFMVDQGGLSAFALARASLLSAMFFLAIGLVANIPNRRIIANLQTVQVNHDGGIVSEGDNRPHIVSNVGHREAAAADALITTSGYVGGPIHGIVRLGRVSAPPGLGTRASGGPPVRPVSLAEALRQLTLISVIVWITSFLLRQSTGIGRRVVLAVLGLLGIAASVAFGQVPTPPIQQQIQLAAEPLPSFEVATIKPSDPNVPFFITPPGSQQIVHLAGRARGLVAQAYGVPATADRALGGPDWMDKELYRLEGKIPDDVFAQMQTMSGAERQGQAMLMLRSLLGDRFKLRAHMETREAQVYELVLAKGGAKLPPPNAPPADGKAMAAQMGGGMVANNGQVRVRNMTLDGMLTVGWFGLGRPIVNKTGLTGTYNLTLNWDPDIPGQSGPNEPLAAPEGQASIFTALEEQLGLKLVPAKGPIEVVVIDSIERPSEN